MPINYEKGVLPENYVPNTYESLGNMIGKIAEQKITTVDATNKLAIFSKKLPMNGDTIEQVVIKLSNSTAYDPEGAGALTRQNPSLAVRMFKTWNRRKFKATRDIALMTKVLQEGKGSGTLAAGIVAELYPSDEQEHYENIKDLLMYSRQEIDGGKGESRNSLVNISTVDYNNGIDYKEILVQLKDAISGMKFVNTDFNTAGIKRATKEKDIVIIMPYKIKNKIDVNELAAVFNLEKAEIGKHIHEVDIPANENGEYFIFVLDQNCVLDYTRLYDMVDQKNADGYFWNYFLHVERLFAISQLFDGGYIKVKTKEPANNG